MSNSMEMLGRIVEKLVFLEQRCEEVLGVTYDILDKLIDNPNIWIPKLKRFARKEPCWVETESAVCYLKLISNGTKIEIGATDGQDTIAQAKDTFPGYIDSDFLNYETDVKDQPTKETPVQVMELITNSNFLQIFGGFGENLDRLCLSQSQIISFVKNYKKWLRMDGYGTFFLFKVKNEFFVACVLWYEDRFRVFMYRLSSADVWLAGSQHRIVIPQL